MYRNVLYAQRIIAPNKFSAEGVLCIAETNELANHIRLHLERFPNSGFSHWDVTMPHIVGNINLFIRDHYFGRIRDDVPRFKDHPTLEQLSEIIEKYKKEAP